MAVAVVGIAGSALAADTIKVGYLGPLTGIFAQAGKDMLDGLKLGFEQAGGQVTGKKIEVRGVPESSGLHA